MEELIHLESTPPLPCPALPEEKGLGEPWEEIDSAMKRSLHLVTPALVAHEYHSKESKASIEKRSILPVIARKDGLRGAVNTPNQGTRERLKLIRAIASEDSEQSYQQTLRRRSISLNPQPTYLQVKKRRVLEKKVAKLEIAGAVEVSLSTHPLPKPDISLPIERHPNLGKQNFHLALNTIHEESCVLEQTTSIFRFGQGEMLRQRKAPLYRHRSEGKCDRLPAISIVHPLAQDKVIQAVTPKDASPTIHRIHNISNPSKSLDKHNERLREWSRVSVSKKYKVFLNPQARTNKLKLR